MKPVKSSFLAVHNPEFARLKLENQQVTRGSKNPGLDSLSCRQHAGKEVFKTRAVSEKTTVQIVLAHY